MSLKEYRHKRDFTRTKEPVGKNQKRSKAQFLYVIQKHAASHLHYDFRLELHGVLKSWAVPKGPSLDPKVKHLAVNVEDHPLEYAHFEGIIPPGEYGGGTVMIWDIGKWQPLDENPLQAYYKGDLNFILQGKKLKGRWKLIKLKRNFEKGKDQWLLFKVTDEYSKAEEKYDIKKEEPYSAESDRSMQQIGQEKERVWTKKGELKQKSKPFRRRLSINFSKLLGTKKIAMPKIISPELATLVTKPPQGDEWLHEIKWDGYRLITRIDQGEVTLLTRRNKDWTYHFPSLVRSLKRAKFKNIILDGEVVALDKNNKTNFQILQNSLEEPEINTSLVYYVFDLLYYNGYDVQNLPLIKRKELLEAILNLHSITDEIKYNDHIIGNGKDVFKKACDYDLEGIISKRINGNYYQKRTKDWLKIKCIRRQEFVIGGYTNPKSSRQFFGALLLGYYNHNGQLIYCGRVGTGFNYDSLKTISEQLAKYRQATNPFDQFSERVSKEINWIKPKLVAEIEYLEITGDGLLRHPSFKGLRKDKKPKTIKLEIPQEIKRITSDMKNKNQGNSSLSRKQKYNEFTNLERVLYQEQGITKGDLLEYYESVAEWILPHVKNRPLTLVRCPSGNLKECFYQKHMNENVPTAIKSLEIIEHGKPEPYIYINNIKGLLGLVQMGVLEIHPWGSNNHNVESPDRIIFDLDPSPQVSWDEVVEGAKELHQFLNYLKLKNFVKTTGGKGLHIVIPIKPTLSWVEIRNITKRIADLMVEINPKKYIATMSKAKREGKIFIDYLRNTRGATAIAAYSTRAKPSASIAVPLTFEELSTGIRADTFNVKNINERLKLLKTDPWEGFFKTKQTITAKIQKILGF